MKRVAIHGFVPDSLGDFVDYVGKHPDAEVWGYNASSRLRNSRYDRWYEMHAERALGDDWANLKRAKCRVVMQRVHQRVPRSEAYPIDAAKALLVYPYITNTVTLMVAHAILDGFEEIALFGVDMAVRMGDGPSELSEQRPSVEFALGIAIGRGLSIVIPGGSDLLKTNVVYGYDEHVDSLHTRLRRRHEWLMRQRDRYQGLADVYRGAADEIDGIVVRYLSENEKA